MKKAPHCLSGSSQSGGGDITECLPCSTVSEEIAMNRMLEGDREGMVLQREMDLGGVLLLDPLTRKDSFWEYRTWLGQILLNII